MLPSAQQRARNSVHDGIAALRGGSGRDLLTWLREHLFGHVLPFWERHALDPHGGLLTCLADDGRVVSTDKWLWSQWRAVWVFSRIYNQLDADPKWLRHAEGIAVFCRRTGWVESSGGWALVLGQDGTILRGNESTYTDVFAIYGLQELYKAVGDPALLADARRTADRALLQLAGPYDQIPHFPYSLPGGARPHGIPMMWSLKLAELAATIGEERYRNAAVDLSTQIFRDYYHRERDLLIEMVPAAGAALPGPQSRVVVPGHVIEDMWFQRHICELTGRGRERIPELHRLALRHLDAGWDHAGGGGLLLAIDAEGREPVGWAHADTKLWWPHTEALYAALLGWTETGQPAFLDWYQRVWDICLAHFVDWEHGEWRQKLDRNFSPIDTVVALPVKDPFHLARCLILQIELLEKQIPGAAPRRD